MLAQQEFNIRLNNLQEKIHYWRQICEMDGNRKDIYGMLHKIVKGWAAENFDIFGIEIIIDEQYLQDTKYEEHMKRSAVMKAALKIDKISSFEEVTTRDWFPHKRIQTTFVVMRREGLK